MAEKGIDEKRPVRRWIIESGIVALLFGIGTVVITNFPGFYWWGVGSIYLSFLMLIGCLVTQRIRPVWKGLLLLALLVLAWAFTKALVLYKEPLVFSAELRSSDYEPNTAVAGIKWRPEFSEVRIAIADNEKFDVTDLDFRISPEMASVIEARELNDVSGCRVYGNITREPIAFGGEQVLSTSFRVAGKDVSETQLSAPFVDVHCDRLRNGEPITLVLACADVDQNHTPFAHYISDMKSDGNIIDHATMGDNQIVEGSTDPNVPIVYKKSIPSSIVITGRYTAMYRNRELSRQFLYLPLPKRSAE